jgi:recombination protein RecA
MVGVRGIAASLRRPDGARSPQGGPRRRVPASSSPEARLDLVDELVRELEARFGPGIIYRLSRARPKLGTAALSTGSLGLDRASGIGGVPRGRLSVFLGGDSSGKTTLACHLLAEAQRDGGLAALIDGEGSADPRSMRACGVDLDDLILASPADAVEALEMAEVLVRCRALDAVVFIGGQGPGVGPLSQWRADSAERRGRGAFWSSALRRLNTWLKAAPTAVVIVEDDGGRRTTDDGRRQLHSAPATGRRPPAAAPLSFFASLIVEFRQVRPIFGPGGDLLGLRVRTIVAKNRLAPPGGQAEFEVLSGRGLRRAAEVLEHALALGVVERCSQGLAWGRVFLGRSLAAAQAALEADPELTVAIVAEVRSQKSESRRQE